MARTTQLSIPGQWQNNEYNRMERSARRQSEVHPGIYLEGLSKHMKTVTMYMLFQGLDLNPGPPEYETGVLPSGPKTWVGAVKNRYRAHRPL